MTKEIKQATIAIDKLNRDESQLISKVDTIPLPSRPGVSPMTEKVLKQLKQQV
jgi:hypothetical protein